MTLTQKRFLIPIAIVAIPVLGYAVMHLTLYLFPMQEGGTPTYLLVTVLIIALGLAIPYWLLKTSLFQAKLNEPTENSFKISDIPKDRDDMERTLDNKDPH